MNVFQLFKKKYIPDMEFTFDVLSEVLDEVLKKYPDVKYETVNSSTTGFIVILPEGYEIYMTLCPNEYSTGAPLANISLDYRGKREIGNVYLSGEEYVTDRTFLKRFCNTSYSKYKKDTFIWDKETTSETGPADAVAVTEWLVDIMRQVDNKLDKDGVEFRIRKQSESKHGNPYDDDYYD